MSLSRVLGQPLRPCGTSRALWREMPCDFPSQWKPCFVLLMLVAFLGSGSHSRSLRTSNIELEGTWGVSQLSAFRLIGLNHEERKAFYNTTQDIHKWTSNCYKSFSRQYLLLLHDYFLILSILFCSVKQQQKQPTNGFHDPTVRCSYKSEKHRSSRTLY